MVSAKSVRVLEHHKQHFYEYGFVIFERVIPIEHLEILRSECDRIRSEIDEEMEREGFEIRGLTHYKRNYFFCAYKRSTELHKFIFSDLTEEICRALLGSDTAYLFYETYIFKCPRTGLPFSWHQDSGYINRKHQPFITLWCTLDDVDDKNGSLRVLPYERAGTKVCQPHTLINQNSPEKVGYYGEDPGDPIILPAGSIAVLSSTTFHRSGPNNSDQQRRAYLIDFSPEIVLSDNDNTKLRALAEPFLQNGQRVV